MSTRALRKLQETASDKPQAAAGGENDSSSEDDVEDTAEHDDGKAVKNRFLLLEDSIDAEDLEQAPKCENSASGELSQIGESTNREIVTKNQKKKKAKKQQQKKSGGGAEMTKSDDFSQFAENVDAPVLDDNANSAITIDTAAAYFHLAESALFQIEYRNLNPENELKRMFGKNILDVKNERRPIKKVVRTTGGQVRLGGKLVKPKDNVTWQVAKTGLSMILEKPLQNGVNLFKFEHSPAYQNAQFLFWDAAKRMNPDLFVSILRDHPFHLDTLLQMSDIYKVNEDFATARDLTERAIYACETAFHPLFNVALNNARLDYRQQENRSFFLALFKHMNYCFQRACYRTALEFCKLIYSLDPDEDPLGMLLIIDFLCLRSKQYDYLINLYHVLEAKRNLSQLPNFSYSVAMATFFKSRDNENAKKEADEKLQEALCKFPTVLPMLLDKCCVEPDAEVSKCDAFTVKEQFSDGNGLKCLYYVFVDRCYSLWKDADVVYWLETNVKSLIGQNFMTSRDQFAVFKENRMTRYHLTPLNICRHVILCELKEPMAYLPDDVKQRSINNYDPLPPNDSRCAYKRPNDILNGNSPGQSESSSGQGSSTSTVSLMGSFLTSLLPNYNPADHDEMVAAGLTDFPHSVGAVLRAMRDLLNDIQPIPADASVGGDPENDPDPDAHESDTPDAWTDEDVD